MGGREEELEAREEDLRGTEEELGGGDEEIGVERWIKPLMGNSYMAASCQELLDRTVLAAPFSPD